MSPTTFEQFVRFTTDLVGLERTLRLFQATAQIISSYPLALGLLVYILNLSTEKPPSLSAIQSIFLALRHRLGVTRQFFRVFRCLESFNAAYKVYLTISPSISGKRKPSWVQAETWLDVLGRTFNGMYLLLDALIIIDTLQIEGLNVWTPEWKRTIFVEGQRFWLFSLVCGVISGLLQMLMVLAYTPVPATGDGFAHGKSEGSKPAEKEKENSDEDEVLDVKKEQERLRNIVKNRKKGRVLWMREVRAKLHGLGRRVTANALDIILPGVAVGWINVEPGTVGLAMFVTTILTGMDVWERCGKEVAGENSK